LGVTGGSVFILVAGMLCKDLHLREEA